MQKANPYHDELGRFTFAHGGGGGGGTSITNDPMGAPYGASGNTTSGGGGSTSEITGPYSRQIKDSRAELDAALAHLKALNRGQVDPNDPDSVAAAADVNQKQTRLNALWAQRRAAMGPQKPTVATVGGQSVEDWLAANDPNYKKPPTEAERLAAATERRYTINRNGVQVQAYRDKDGTYRPVVDAQGRMMAASSNPASTEVSQTSANQSFYDPSELPSASTRARIAEVSDKAAAATRNVAAALALASSIKGGGSADNPTTWGRAATLAGALTTMATAVSMASRARNTATLLNAVGSAHSSVQTMRSELPQLRDAAVAQSPRVRQTLASASTSLQQLSQALEQSRTSALASAKQTATRTAFAATGGTIVPAPPYRPPVTTVTAAPPRRVTGPVKLTTITIKPPTYPKRT
jgi:hypothetical protein